MPIPGSDRPSRIKRSEVASFLWQNNTRIKELVRSKMGSASRGVADSDDVVASVVRRMTTMMQRSEGTDLHEEEVWRLISTIVRHDVVSKARLVQRARALIAEDGDYARLLERRAASCVHDEAASDLVMELYLVLGESTDRQIFLLRTRGASHHVIAGLLGLSDAAVRQRWSVLTRRLSQQLRAGDV